jgi:hypothetical protein
LPGRHGLHRAIKHIKEKKRRWRRTDMSKETRQVVRESRSL